VSKTYKLCGKWLVDLSKFSKGIAEGLKEQGNNSDSSKIVFPLLTLAQGDDSDEMLWQMLRFLEAKHICRDDLIDALQGAMDRPDLMKRYFFAFIAGLMEAEATRSE